MTDIVCDDVNYHTVSVSKYSKICSTWVSFGLAWGSSITVFERLVYEKT